MIMIANGRDIIRAGYAEGLSCAAIAAQIGSTVGSVKVIAHKMGIRHRRYVSERIPAHLQPDYWHMMQRKALPKTYICRVLGVSP